MTSINNHFQQVLASFCSRLTREELEDFKFSDLSHVKTEILKIQHEQGQKKALQNLPRIKRFLEAMNEYGRVIEVFLNASEFLCFIWGPMKFCLQVTRQ